MTLTSIQKLLKDNIFFFKAFSLLLIIFVFLFLLSVDRFNYNPLKVKIFFTTTQNAQLDMHLKKNQFTYDPQNNQYLPGIIEKLNQESYSSTEIERKGTATLTDRLSFARRQEFARNKKDQRRFVTQLFFTQNKFTNTISTSASLEQREEVVKFFRNFIKAHNDYIIKFYIKSIFEREKAMVNLRFNKKIKTHEKRIRNNLSVIQTVIPNISGISTAKLQKLTPKLGKELKTFYNLEVIYNLDFSRFLLNRHFQKDKVINSLARGEVSKKKKKTEGLKDEFGNFYEKKREKRVEQKFSQSQFIRMIEKITKSPLNDINKEMISSNAALLSYLSNLEALRNIKNKNYVFFEDLQFYQEEINYINEKQKEVESLYRTVLPKIKIIFEEKNYLKYILSLILFLSLSLATALTLLKNNLSLRK